MKPYYSDYIRHCMRFYARHPQPKFRSDIDKQNWNACDKAMKEFTEEEQVILMTVYREGDTIPDNIYKISVELNTNQDFIWKIVNELERKVAKRRSLI